MRYNPVIFWGGAAVLAFGMKTFVLDDGQAAGRVAEGDDNVIAVSSGDGAMAEARARAEASLPQFLAHAASGDLEQPMLKVAFPTPAGAEHIWVTEFSESGDGRFLGLLSNEPVGMEGYHLGSRVSFARDQISDWSFMENGTGYGFYSVRALVPHMSEEQQVAVAAFLSADPLPQGW
jgi:uncharacterized protein YegJ (DUF2314 family)